MCSVSILSSVTRHGERFVRAACNRDERRTRPTALPPVRRAFGNHCAVFPIDPVAGGTWIAVTSAGLGFTVLNRNDAQQPKREYQHSRGLIIPELLSAETLEEAVDRVFDLEAAQFVPFRLVLLSDHEYAEFLSGDQTVELRCRSDLTSPAFFTSSGLGDHFVDVPRRDVFRQFLRNGSANRQKQDALHCHCWPDRPELSICMSRSDARTVSYTTLEIRRSQVALHYHADAPGTAAQKWSLSVPRRVPLAQSCPA
jgi:uncharacterized protein with NRDE domain